MPRVSTELVRQLAEMTGLALDDSRAKVVAARLSSVLEELDAIDDEALAGVEPAPIFVPVEGEQDRDG
jgi:Asp-tRNA(Asn)/Glu-tRNA(Gln) amidotransferase C subunit